jgi:hypothetical protein
MMDDVFGILYNQRIVRQQSRITPSFLGTSTWDVFTRKVCELQDMAQHPSMHDRPLYVGIMLHYTSSDIWRPDGKAQPPLLRTISHNPLQGKKTSRNGY